LLLAVAGLAPGGAVAQADPGNSWTPAAPAAGPGIARLLTPEQREALRARFAPDRATDRATEHTPEQRAEFQRQLMEQRAAQRRAAAAPRPPAEPPPKAPPASPAPPAPQGPNYPGPHLTPEERRQLREQIRETHREWKVGRRAPKG
jgi:hypothetical protein